MALLNPPGSLPGELQAIIHALVSTKTNEMQQDELNFLITPPSLSSGVADGKAASESDTMVVGRSTGILLEEKGRVSVNHEVAKLIGSYFAPTTLRSVLRRWYCKEVELQEARTSNNGAADFARAAAWYLLQDPLAPPTSWEEVQDLTTRQLSFADRVLENNTRWGALGRWMPYLGLAVHDPREVSGRASQQVLVPDPTTAVRDELPGLAPKVGTSYPLKPFVDSLGTLCPILDGGLYSRVVQEMVIPGSLSQDVDVLSRCLSHALLRLDDAGIIRLHDQADASKTLLAVHGEPVPFSHIERRAV